MDCIKAKYDYLVVGAGLFGAVFANRMKAKNKTCLILERRGHIAGNVYSQETEGIQVHMYGPHIFHTDQKYIWDFVKQFADFNHFIYCPVANYKGELYNLPFNMNTFYQMWSVSTPAQAREIINRQIEESNISQPRNLEEQAISLVGRDIYEKLIQGYTRKQWGRDCASLPSFIIRRLPVRYVFDNNYFNHPYQGIPIGGYTKMVERMLEGTDLRLNVDYLKEKEYYDSLAHKVIFTGPIDEYYQYSQGELGYRSLRFEHEVLDMDNYQGVAGMNYTDADTPYTRIIEHKHFEPGKGNPGKTVITREYPLSWTKGQEPYYPVNDEHNKALYKKYRQLAIREKNIIFGGRLGSYQYMDMDQVIGKALELADNM